MRARTLLLAGLTALALAAAWLLAASSPPTAQERFARADARLRDLLADARARAGAAAADLADLADLAARDRVAAFEGARAARERAGADGVVLLGADGEASVWAGRTFGLDVEIDLYDVRQGSPTVGILDHPAQRVLYAARPAGDAIAVAFDVFDERFPRGTGLAERIAAHAHLLHARLRFGTEVVEPPGEDAPPHDVSVVDGLAHATWFAPRPDAIAAEAHAARAVRLRAIAWFGLALAAVFALRRLAASGAGAGRGGVAALRALGALLVIALRVALHRLGLPAATGFDGDPGAPFALLPWSGPGEVFLSSLALLVAVVLLARAARAWRAKAPRRRALLLGATATGLLAFAPAFYLARVGALAVGPDDTTLFDPLRVLPDAPAALLLVSLCLLTAALFVAARAAQLLLGRVHPLLGLLPVAAVLAGGLPWPGPLLAAGCGLALLGLERAGTAPERSAVLALLAAVVSFPPLYAAQRESFVREAAVEARRRMLGGGASALEQRLDRAVARATDPLEGVDREIAERLARGVPAADAAFQLWAAADWDARDACAVQVLDREGQLVSTFEFDSPPAWWLPPLPGAPRGGADLKAGQGRGASIRFHVRDIELRTVLVGRQVGMARFAVPDPWDMLLSSRRSSMFSEPPDLIVRGGRRPRWIGDLAPDGTPRRASGGATADLPPLSAALLAETRDRGFADRRVEFRGEPARLVLAAAGYDFAALVFEEDPLEQGGFAFAKVLLVDTALCLLYLVALAIARRGRAHLMFRHRVALFLVLLSLPPVVLLALYNRTIAQQQYERGIRERLEARLDLAENLLRSSGERIDDDWCTRFAAVHGMDLNAYRGAQLVATSRPGVWDTGLLSRRLAADPYVQLHLRGRADDAGSEPFAGETGLRSAYRKVSLEQEPGPVILAAPALEDRRELERRAAQSNALLLAGYLVAAIVTVFGGLLLARTLTRPLQQLREATGRVGAGRLDVALPEERGDEFGELMRAFNRMTAELADAQELRVRAGKAAAWREMARQIAHDVKNPLTPIKLTIQNLLAAHDEDPELFARQFAEGSRLILAQIDALYRIAGQFSAYARLPSGEPRPFDLRGLAEEVTALHAAAGDVATTLAPGTPDEPVTVFGDRDELRRALINLVTNAQQARARRVELELSADDRRAVLVVRDDGAGMPAAMLGRVFEPAFTTKTSGTGLGLPIVKRIVDDHAGSIEIESREGRGTAVRIELPRRRRADPPGA